MQQVQQSTQNSQQSMVSRFCRASSESTGRQVEQNSVFSLCRDFLVKERHDLVAAGKQAINFGRRKPAFQFTRGKQLSGLT